MIGKGSVVRSKVDIKTESTIMLKEGTKGVIEEILGRHPEWGRKFSVRFEGQPYLHSFHEDELAEDTGSYITPINTRKNPACRSKPSQGQQDAGATCSCPACQDLLPVEPQSEEAMRKWSVLERTLLDLGGERVVRRPDEPYVSELSARGRLLTEPVQERTGKPNECHANAGRLWGTDVTGTQLVTGYALSEGLWRQHSWVILDGQLLETTVKAQKYFGFVLNDVEAVLFWFVNVKPGEEHNPPDMPQVEKDWPGPMGLFRTHLPEVVANFKAKLSAENVPYTSSVPSDSITGEPDMSDALPHQGIKFSRFKMGNSNGRVKLNIERLQADGYTEDEILRIQDYCNAAMKAGRFDSRPTLTMLNNARALCCRTLTEIMDKVRPGVWLDRKRKPWYSKRSRPKKAGR